MDTPTPAQTAHTDQQATAVREVGRVLGAYRRSLIENGIPEDQARELTAAYAETYWQNALHKCCPCPPEFDVE